MGIKEINKTLKKIAPNAFMEVPLHKFSGHAIGIDASLWMFKTKSSAMKDVLRHTKDPLQALDEAKIIESMISQFYGFVYKLVSFGITPVWIFDGKTHPAKIAVDRRKKVRSTKKITIEEERERLLKLDPLERALEIDKFIKGLLGCFSFSKKEESTIKEEAMSLGLPVFEAPYDAEIFGSALSRRNLLLGVWSTDTDTYPAGSLITISGQSKSISKEGPKVEIVCLAIILDTLGLTREEFRDFCIMNECDFNQRIPKLGPSNIIKKMEEYDWNLDNLMKAEPNLDWSLLNVEECRTIFDGPDVSMYSISDMKINKDKWNTHMRGKAFDMDLPPDPQIVKTH